MNDNKKLLLIENDLADQANSLCLFLKSQNGPYIVTCVTSLIEAEKYLSSQYFDLILLEHRLIKDRIHTLSDVFRQIPVILITDEDDVDVIEMMKQGADDVIRGDHEGKYRKYLPVVIQKSLARQQLMAKRMDKLQSHVSGEGILLRRLTDTLAHDLSNVISPLLGFSKIILDETEQNDPHFELLHEIHSSALRAKNMVRQLSIFREKDASSFKLINLGDALQDFHKALQSIFRENVTLDIQTKMMAPAILGDIALIEQAVMHLCLSLQAAIHHKGRVCLSIHQLHDEEKMRYKEATHQSYLVLKAEAKTLSGEIQPHITTEGGQAGRCSDSCEIPGGESGWALVHAIVKQHHGFIHTDKDKNQVRVTLNFPCSDESASTDTGPAVGKAIRECCESILLVEDDLSLQRLITVVLEQQGYTVYAVESEQHAYELASQGRTRVDMLIADAAMVTPGNNRIITTLATHNNNVKAYYLAAPSYQKDSISSGKAGTEHILNKPFSLSLLTECVRKTLDGEP